jgi:hypothetical protein
MATFTFDIPDEEVALMQRYLADAAARHIFAGGPAEPPVPTVQQFLAETLLMASRSVGTWMIRDQPEGTR